MLLISSARFRIVHAQTSDSCVCHYRIALLNCLLISISVLKSLLVCLLNSLVVECLLRVREVQGSIPSQGPRHTKEFIKMVPVVHFFSTQH